MKAIIGILIMVMSGLVPNHVAMQGVVTVSNPQYEYMEVTTEDGNIWAIEEEYVLEYNSEVILILDTQGTEACEDDVIKYVITGKSL